MALHVEPHTIVKQHHLAVYDVIVSEAYTSTLYRQKKMKFQSSRTRQIILQTVGSINNHQKFALKLRERKEKVVDVKASKLYVEAPQSFF